MEGVSRHEAFFEACYEEDETIKKSRQAILWGKLMMCFPYHMAMLLFRIEVFGGNSKVHSVGYKLPYNPLNNSLTFQFMFEVDLKDYLLKI